MLSLVRCQLHVGLRHVLHMELLHDLHLGLELPIGQRLTQGLFLLHNAQHDVLVSLVLHMELLHDLHLGAELPIGQRLARASFYFLISLLLSEHN